MPFLRTWMVHFPRDWTDADRMMYTNDTANTLVRGMTPTAQALGPVATAHILLTVVAYLAVKNPVFLQDILKVMADTFEQIESRDPFKAAGATS